MENKFEIIEDRSPYYIRFSYYGVKELVKWTLRCWHANTDFSLSKTDLARDLHHPGVLTNRKFSESVLDSM